jgi:hypothetical protein
MEALIAVGVLLFILVLTLGAVDSRDGRDWQPRHEGD